MPKLNLLFQISFTTLTLLLIFLVIAVAQQNNELMSKAQELFESIPETVELENNPITPEKVELGKMLWFDPRLSSSGLISCNSCHNVGLKGTDLQRTSIGHGWQHGPRNAPTMLNAVFHVAQFWDGRAADLFEQAQGPVQAGAEMNNTPENAVETLSSISAYYTRFNQVFPEDGVTFENMARAIAAFEATLITPNAPFDQYLLGNDEALTEVEKEGLQLFMDKGCVTCHNGVAVGGNSYQKFGVIEDPSDTIRPPEDIGRAKLTDNEADQYVFKVPSLRNITQTGPYFHSGAVDTLDEAVHVMAEVQLGISLEDEEVSKIMAFLGTLTGEEPDITYPLLPASTSTTPKPKPGTEGKAAH